MKSLFSLLYPEDMYSVGTKLIRKSHNQTWIPEIGVITEVKYNRVLCCDLYFVEAMPFKLENIEAFYEVAI